MMVKLSSRNLTSDLFLILTSLLIAFVIWMIAKRTDLKITSFEVPIVLKNVPSNFEDQLPVQKAKLEARFPQSAEMFVHPSNFRVEIEWNELGDPREFAGIDDFEESAPINLSARNIVMASEIGEDRQYEITRQLHLTILSPTQISIKTRFITREAKIVFQTRGRTPENYRLVPPILPKLDRKILLTASPKRFSELDAADPDKPVEVLTDEIDLTGHSESFTQITQLQLPDNTSLVYKEDRRIEVQVTIEPIIGQHVVRDVPIVIDLADKSRAYEYEPKSGEISIRAPQQVLEDIRPTDFMIVPIRPPALNADGRASVSLQAAFSNSATPQVRSATKILSFKPATVSLRHVPPPMLTPLPSPSAETENEESNQPGIMRNIFPFSR